MKTLTPRVSFRSSLSIIVFFIASLLVLFTLCPLQAQELKTIKLPTVNKNRGSSLMDALSNKASAQSLSDRDLSQQDLSDLLWAAAGINRPDSKKRTYSSAMNTQDVEIYVFIKDGVYIYDYENHALNLVISGDHRADISASLSMGGSGPSGSARGGAPGGSAPGGAPAEAGQPGGAPGGAPGGSAPGGTQSGARGGTAGGPSAGGARGGLSTFAIDLLIVSDPAKYRAGTDDLKNEWGSFSAGMISQNVMLFCSANNMGTHPRAAFDKTTLRTLLKLKDTQNPVIELPVGYME